MRAFPRINRLSYQIFLLSALVLLSSFLVKGVTVRRRMDRLSSALGKCGAFNLTPGRRHACGCSLSCWNLSRFAGRNQFHRDRRDGTAGRRA